jgi:hypothetical protein
VDMQEELERRHTLTSLPLNVDRDCRFEVELPERTESQNCIVFVWVCLSISPIGAGAELTLHGCSKYDPGV